jgi:hypothetical protein
MIIGHHISAKARHKSAFVCLLQSLQVARHLCALHWIGNAVLTSFCQLILDAFFGKLLLERIAY